MSWVRCRSRCHRWGLFRPSLVVPHAGPTKTDPLNGLGSGHWLETERWPAALRSGLARSVAYLDLDHLKARNDQHGHALGDLYIQEAASALQQASRRGVDEVFRLYTADDEFFTCSKRPTRRVSSCAC